ncbi:hypothetical protein J7E88_32280 [Streptomyces sp. ISL-10]|uniref:hypothetical protein n=1 Tax=Streptomyces sp. ISL-10 TaxID=2819172 RepID=UPI001BEC16F6|nr:hypothetical protein [Streptomyces sp. ISL-10]MBT2369825.1 hypothetical protein [Streptomyces sp. ISL-10]
MTGMIGQLTPEHFQGLAKVPARSTVSEWLSGVALRWDFVEAVIDICSPDAATAQTMRHEARALWSEAERKNREQRKKHQQPEIARPISEEKLLTWLAQTPAPSAEHENDSPSQASGRRIADKLSQSNIIPLVEGLLDSLHPRTWEVLIRELRTQGKDTHAEQLIRGLGLRGDPHKIVPIVDFLRTEGHFGDDRILLESIAGNRTVDDLVTIIEAFHRNKQELSAKIVIEKIGVARDSISTVKILLEFKEKKEVKTLAGILEGAGKWREAAELAKLVNTLRAEGAGEAADLILMAAGAERGASSFPQLVQALKESCPAGDMIKLAHAVGTLRARTRLQPLEDTLWKNNHSDIITLVRRLSNHQIFP